MLSNNSHLSRLGRNGYIPRTAPKLAFVLAPGFFLVRNCREKIARFSSTSSLDNAIAKLKYKK
ncbi:MAG: hypothetical protein IGS23_04460 [Rivularia sp. T60_A2020_040]|nr:hypothetical protein [Rivularia sp. T60_A2020_040]